MRRLGRGVLLLTGWLLLGAVAALVVQAAEPVSLTDLVFQKARFDRRVVIVSGTVGMMEGPLGSPRGGLRAQSFWLEERGASVRVIAPPLPIVRPGDRIEVEGTYQLIPDAIEATHIAPRFR
jgi:hypothetical protein